MFNFYKKYSVCLFTACILSLTGTNAYAAYEVVSAKTVNVETETPKPKEIIIPTYNDPDLPDFSPENAVSTKVERKLRTFFKKRKKVEIEQIEEETLPLESDIEIEPAKQTDSDLADVEIDEKNKFQINADKISYNDEEGNVYAKGHVEIIAKSQGITLKADDAVLDKTNQTLKLYNNVKILKDNLEMSGEYLLVDLNEQNILMDEPSLQAYSFVAKAQEGFLIENNLQMLNGTLKSAKQVEFPLVSRGFMRLDNIGAGTNDDYLDDFSALDESPKKQSYRIDTKEIVVSSFKDHNSVVLKGANVYYNKHKIVNNSDIEIISDKEKQVIETNMIEAGTIRNFGTYIGYGMLYKLPKGQTLKLMPTLSWGDSNIGVGLIARHRSKNSMLEAGWNTSTTNLVARGKYKFGKSLSLVYGRNAYMPEGFMGARRSGYAAQLQYLKGYYVDDLGIKFNHGIYGGFYTDYQKHKQEEAYATTRFRYIADMSKELLKYENKEQDLKISLNAATQGSATVYGSGQTVGVVRIGPYISSRLKFWESHIGYALAGIHGDSPFVFDKYRYGKSSIMFNQKFKVNDKFAFGYKAYITPAKDNYERDLLTESRLFAIFGPRDAKMALSYDFVRDIAHLDFMFLLGSDSAKIDFEKLTTKDFDGGSEKRDFYKNAKRVRIEPAENI